MSGARQRIAVGGVGLALALGLLGWIVFHDSAPRRADVTVDAQDRSVSTPGPTVALVGADAAPLPVDPTPGSAATPAEPSAPSLRSTARPSVQRVPVLVTVRAGELPKSDMLVDLRWDPLGQGDRGRATALEGLTHPDGVATFELSRQPDVPLALTARIANEEWVAPAVRVDVPAGGSALLEPVELALEVAPARRVRGHVYVGDGTELANGGTLRVLEPGAERTELERHTIAADGSFVIFLAVDREVVLSVQLPSGASDERLLPGHLYYTSLYATLRGPLAGQLLDLSGRPVEGIGVRLEHDDESELPFMLRTDVPDTTTDAEGRFHFETVRVSSASLSAYWSNAFNPDPVWPMAAGLVPGAERELVFRVPLTRVTVVALGATRGELDAPLPIRRVSTGRWHEERVREDPAQAVFRLLSPAEKNYPSDSPSALLFGAGRAEPGGWRRLADPARFEAERSSSDTGELEFLVEAGRDYRLTFDAWGYEHLERWVDVVPGTAELRVELRPSPRANLVDVEFVIVDDAGLLSSGRLDWMVEHAVPGAPTQQLQLTSDGPRATIALPSGRFTAQAYFPIEATDWTSAYRLNEAGELVATVGVSLTVDVDAERAAGEASGPQRFELRTSRATVPREGGSSSIRVPEQER